MSRGAWRKSWVKLYITGWLHGSIRWELEPEERSVWADLIALAGQCGKDGAIVDNDDKPLPWPFIAGQLNIPVELLSRTIVKCKRGGRLEDCEGDKLVLTNFKMYQSEYQRQKPYREAQKDREKSGLPGGKSYQDLVQR